jgi:hypothetical protein
MELTTPSHKNNGVVNDHFPISVFLQLTIKFGLLNLILRLLEATRKNLNGVHATDDAAQNVDYTNHTFIVHQNQIFFSVELQQYPLRLFVETLN